MNAYSRCLLMLTCIARAACVPRSGEELSIWAPRKFASINISGTYNGDECVELNQ